METQVIVSIDGFINSNVNHIENNRELQWKPIGKCINNRKTIRQFQIFARKIVVLNRREELVEPPQHRMYTYQAYVLVGHDSVTIGKLQMSLRFFCTFFWKFPIWGYQHKKSPVYFYIHSRYEYIYLRTCSCGEEIGFSTIHHMFKSAIPVL